LFNKRWEQFTAIRDFMGKIRTRGKVSQDDLYNFIVDTRGCRFLFDNEIKILVEEIFNKASYLNMLEEELKDLKTKEERKRIIGNQRKTKNWLESQINSIENRFKKFLQL